jgi:hypothetical protein
MRSDGPVFALGEVACGKLLLRQADRFPEQVQQLRDGVYEIRLERLRATRSQQQNRFYWSVIMQTLADHTGHSPDELHEICKAKFLPKQLAMTDGNGEIVGEFVIGGTTTTLSTEQFRDYCDRIMAWADETLGMRFGEHA